MDQSAPPVCILAMLLAVTNVLMKNIDTRNARRQRWGDCAGIVLQGSPQDVFQLRGVVQEQVLTPLRYLHIRT